MSAALEVSEVVATYGSVTALDGVTLTAAAGEITALLGPNGAGKSTLVSLCAGLSRPSGGEVRVFSADPARERSRIGIAPQEIGVYPQLTVTANLRAFGELHGLGSRAARERASELLSPFALESLADRPAGRLSGGEQRRLHAAIAVVHRPGLVLFDEPTAGADPVTRERILEAVRAQAREGTAVVYTTHYLPEVERLDAPVVMLQAGRVIATGTVAALVAEHAPPPETKVVAPSLETAYLALTGDEEVPLP